jgi:hypothetical protein
MAGYSALAGAGSVRARSMAARMRRACGRGCNYSRAVVPAALILGILVVTIGFALLAAEHPGPSPPSDRRGGFNPESGPAAGP